MSKCYRNREAEDYPPHWHSDIEVIMPLEGSYAAGIDNRRYDMTPGDILVIPPGVIHELYAPDKGTRLIILISYSLSSNISNFFDAVQHFYPCLYVSALTHPFLQEELQALLRRIEEEHTQALPYHADMLISLCREFLVQLARHSHEFIKPQSTRRYAKSVEGFLRVCNFIYTHCSEPLSIARLSEVAGYSKSHFLRMFKEFSNISCGEYIQVQRIAKARQLLADPEKSIADIVSEAGFGSVASFNRVFREQMNCTPTQYRKSIRGQSQEQQ